MSEDDETREARIELQRAVDTESATTEGAEKSIVDPRNSSDASKESAEDPPSRGERISRGEAELDSDRSGESSEHDGSEARLDSVKNEPGNEMAEELQAVNEKDVGDENEFYTEDESVNNHVVKHTEVGADATMGQGRIEPPDHVEEAKEDIEVSNAQHETTEDENYNDTDTDVASGGIDVDEVARILDSGTSQHCEASIESEPPTFKSTDSDGSSAHRPDDIESESTRFPLSLDTESFTNEERPRETEEQGASADPEDDPNAPGAFQVAGMPPGKDQNREIESIPVPIIPATRMRSSEFVECDVDCDAARQPINTRTIVEATPGMDNTARKAKILKDYKRKQMKFAALAILVIAILGVVAGVTLNIVMRSDKGGSPTSHPTNAPTTEGQKKKATIEYLEDFVGVAFEDGSAHALAADWITSEDKIGPISIQRFALALFYFQTTKNGTTAWKRCNPPTNDEEDLCIPGSEEMRWLTRSSECTWHGIYCDEDAKKIIGLQMRSNSLNGMFPSALSLLSDLQQLILFNAMLEGRILEELYRLSNMEYLQISAMPSIVGTISTSVGLLTNLRALDLGSNNISGEIPSEVGKLSLLDFLNLGQNFLTGTIPEEIYRLSLLRSLSLAMSNISGEISSNIGKLTALNELLLYASLLSGQIPKSIRHCTGLTVLQLAESDLSGSVPTEIAELIELKNFLVWQNPRMTGTLPEGLFDLTKLTTLVLGVSSFSGTLSSKIGKLSDLLVLILAGTNIHGTIASEIGLVSANLNWLNLAYNQFSGSLPSEIGRCTELGMLILSRNNLSGSFPKDVTKLTALETLELENNSAMSGTIPDGLFELDQLRTVGLSNMSLIGTLSTSFGLLKKLKFLRLSYNQLTGPVPSEIGSISSLELISIDHTLLLGSVPEELCMPGEFASSTDVSADCRPFDNPPMPCSCCKTCCDRNTSKCLTQEIIRTGD